MQHADDPARAGRARGGCRDSPAAGRHDQRRAVRSALARRRAVDGPRVNGHLIAPGNPHAARRAPLRTSAAREQDGVEHAGRRAPAPATSMRPRARGHGRRRTASGADGWTTTTTRSDDARVESSRCVDHRPAVDRHEQLRRRRAEPRSRGRRPGRSGAGPRQGTCACGDACGRIGRGGDRRAGAAAYRRTRPANTAASARRPSSGWSAAPALARSRRTAPAPRTSPPSGAAAPTAGAD